MKKISKIISIFQCIAIAIACASLSLVNEGTALAAASPAQPALFDTSYSSPSGNTITVNNGGDLQAALNNAQPGDKIILQAGATFTGNFTLPNKSGSGWIYIQSSAYANLPAPGNRVSPANAGNMPKIVTNNSSPAISTAASAHNYRFVGIEIASSNSGTSWTCYNIAYIEAPGQTQVSQAPTDITFDRCYVHGTPTGNIRRGLTFNGIRTAAVDSYVSDCHEIGADSQAIGGWNGPGPFKIVNNYLEGAGENVMFGGTDTSITNMTPSDIEIRGNYFFKPLKWKYNDPSYAGYYWVVKNTLEFKHAQRVIVEGNVFENHWGGQGQSGYALLITPRNQYGTNPWTIVQDITYKNNIMKNLESVFNILGYDDNYPSQQTNDILIQDNLCTGSGGTWMQILSNVTNVTVNHNTIFSNYRIMAPDGVASTLFEFTNNIATRGTYGVIGSNYGEGNSSINQYLPGAVFAKNALIGASSSIYPANNFFPPTVNDIGFVNYAGGDYHLSTSSAYRNAGTDGKDLGGNISAINTATLHSIDGQGGSTTPPPTQTQTPTPVPTSTATPVPTSTYTPTPVPTGEVILTLQNGLNGYNGSKDVSGIKEYINTDGSSWMGYFADGQSGSASIYDDGVRGHNSLIAFDVSQIPANATITSAQLKVYCYWGALSTGTIDLYRITDPDNKGMWVEGSIVSTYRSSGAAYLKRNGDGSALVANPGWTNTSGSTIMDSVAMSGGSPFVSASINMNTSYTGWYSSTDVKADVQSWVNGSAVNQGWYIRPRTGTGVHTLFATNQVESNADAGNNPAYKPQLVITYTVPTVTANREQVGYEAIRAIDGITSAQDPENRWSGDTQFAYITYDLGASKTVKSVDIDWYNVLNQQTKFDIKLSTDGVNFGSPVYTGTSTAVQGYQNYAFTAQTARYVRITGYYNNSSQYSQWVSISELRIKDNNGSIIPVSSVAANREYAGTLAANTIDGITSSQNPENRWSGDSIFAYITADLRAAKTVGSVEIDWYNAVNQQTTFEIQVSTDGTNFTKVYSGTSSSATGFQKYTFTAQSARYVRIVGKANNNSRYPEWVSISELKINPN